MVSGKSVGCKETELLCLHCLPSLRTLCLRAKNTHLEGDTGAVQPMESGQREFKHQPLSQAGTLAWPTGRGCGKKLHRWKKMAVTKAGM